jgi:plastocyanin
MVRSEAKRVITVGALALAFMLALGACGASEAPNTVAMGAADFTGNTSFTIKAGQSLTFTNPSSAEHILVTGVNGLYMPEKGAPSVFNQAVGKTFHSGDKFVYPFTTPGTYHITCTLHPSMEVMITVKA